MTVPRGLEALLLKNRCKTTGTHAESGQRGTQLRECPRPAASSLIWQNPKSTLRRAPRRPDLGREPPKRPKLGRQQACLVVALLKHRYSQVGASFTPSIFNVSDPVDHPCATSGLPEYRYAFNTVEKQHDQSCKPLSGGVDGQLMEQCPIYRAHVVALEITLGLRNASRACVGEQTRRPITHILLTGLLARRSSRIARPLSNSLVAIDKELQHENHR